ncbi:MAG: hypothetical protein EAZ95_06645 [Bacteroidetes bacterium]|nr:MAG: hypothetical protein EAZ95_06645 [Bacteroidota bacterium]
MDAVTIQVLLGVAGNFTTDALKTLWRNVQQYLSQPSQEVVTLISDGNEDDVTKGQEKKLKAEVAEIMTKPEIIALMKELKPSQNNNAHVIGNDNTVIQGMNNSTVHKGNVTNNNVNNQGAKIKNQFNGGTFEKPTFN